MQNENTWRHHVADRLVTWCVGLRSLISYVFLEELIHESIHVRWAQECKFYVHPKLSRNFTQNYKCDFWGCARIICLGTNTNKWELNVKYKINNIHVNIILRQCVHSTVEPTAAVVRITRTLSAICHRNLEFRHNRESRLWGKTHIHTNILFISRQSSLCPTPSPCKFPMALNITNLYDIWHVLTLSTDIGCLSSHPKVVKHWDFCPPVALYSDTATTCVACTVWWANSALYHISLGFYC